MKPIKLHRIVSEMGKPVPAVCWINPAFISFMWPHSEGGTGIKLEHNPWAERFAESPAEVLERILESSR